MELLYVLFNGGVAVVAVAVVEFSTSVFTPFSGIVEILELVLGTNDVSTAVTLDRLPALVLLLVILLFPLLMLEVLVLLETATVTTATKVLLLLMLGVTEDDATIDEMVDIAVVGHVTLDSAVDIQGDETDEDVVTDAATTDDGVVLRDEQAVLGVEVAAVVVVAVEVAVTVVVALSVVDVIVPDKDVKVESVLVVCVSIAVSSLTLAFGLSLPGSVELTTDVLLVSPVLLMLILQLLLVFAALVLLLMLGAVVTVSVEDVVTALDTEDNVHVTSVLVTCARATDDAIAVVVEVVVALDTAVLALILLALQLLLLLLLLLLLVFEDEFVVTLDAELFPIELFVEFAARSRPTVFCCCSRCSLVVTPVVNASTMHCV